MSEPWYFVVERGAGGKPTPAIYHDLLPERLTRKIPRDDRKQPCEPTPIIYALRLDRLPDDSPWRTRSLGENYLAYRETLELPPSNLADPPKAKEETGSLRGNEYKPPPWHWDWRDKPATGAANDG